VVFYSSILPLYSYLSSVVQPTYKKVLRDWENVFDKAAADFIINGFQGIFDSGVGAKLPSGCSK